MTTAATGQKARAADQLVARFEELIVSGHLAAGDPLPPEREIVQEHGVSRTVVREALRILASRGMIKAQPGFRPVVAPAGYDAAMSVVGSQVNRLLNKPKGIRNLFDLRIMMEASLVREAAAQATPDDLARLESALADNLASVEEFERFYDTDMAFHAVLYDIPQNPLLPAIHRAYTDWLAPQWVQMPRKPERNMANYHAHKAVFDAILRRDPDKAEDALKDHLAAAWQQVSTTFGEL